MITEEELKELLNEGLFKRAVSGIKKAFTKTKDAVKDAKDSIKEKIHDIFKPNAGVLKMLQAMEKIAGSKVKLDGVKIYAGLGDEALPVIGFATANKKKTLVLIVDKDSKSAKPKTLTDIRKFIVDDQKIKDVKASIDSIVCAQAPAQLAESALLESKLTDYIDSKKLSKEDALKPDNLKELKKISKQSEDKVKAAIEKHFAKKSTGTPKKQASGKSVDGIENDGKLAASKNGKEKKAKAKKQTSKSEKDDTKSSPSGQPLKKDSDEKKDSSSSPQSTAVDSNKGDAEKQQPEKNGSLKLFDNKFIDVEVADKKDGIKFNFSKSKAEIALDKKYADAFAV